MKSDAIMAADQFVEADLRPRDGLFRRVKVDDWLRAVVAQAQRRWGPTRVAMLWDGDLCVLTDSTMVLTDLKPGLAEAAGTVRVIPRGVVMRISRTERVDPTRKVADLDPASRARAAGFVSGAIGQGMGMAVVLNAAMRATNDPVVWHTVEIEVVRGGRFEIVICHDRVTAAAIEAWGQTPGPD